ncbi:MAG: fibronectin type III domain-containing protein [Proteobacteria bacterium]|nr:fibronectin type III domain-containing protein [Pseudomonadota bacterium]
MKTIASILLFLIFTSTDLYANWAVDIEVVSGKYSSKVSIGAESLASSAYDAGRDMPVVEAGTITAYFSHPEWKVNKGGESFSDFYQDVRGESYPLLWELKVDTGLAGVHKLSWQLPEAMPGGLRLILGLKGGGSVDMHENTSYLFMAASSNIFTIEAVMEETPVPHPPFITDLISRNRALHVHWETEEGAVGYKVHLGTDPTVYERTIAVRNVTNFKIGKLENGKTYYMAVTAYNEEGVESGYSEEVSAAPFNSIPTSPVTGWQYVEEGEDLILRLSGARDDDGETVRYEVEVYSDRQMSQLAVSADADGGEVNLGKLPRGTYYWRARATDGTDYGSWSGTRIIRVDIESEGEVERLEKAYGRKRF